MRRSVFLAVGLLFSLLSSAHSAPQTIPLVNPGFEEGAVGQPAPGWSAASVVLEGGYTVRTVEEKPESGQKCLEIALAGTRKSPQAFGASAQTIDATPYRGKIVRFSAAVRMEGGEADVAQLWMRVDRPNGAIGFFDNMRDRPVTSSSWQRFQITGPVAADAEVIKIGVLLPQGGRTWLDSAAFEVLGDAGAGREAARLLTDRGLDNLVAFAQLYGTVRWFHPSDQAAAADWNSIALAGVQQVEKAADAVELARVLENLFRPLAPTIRVYPTGRRPPLPEALRPAAPQAALRKVGWRHLGVSLSSGRSAYQSVRVDSQGPAGTAAKMAQEIDAAPFRGKKVLLRAAVRADLKAGSQAHLFLRSAAPGGKEEEDTVSITGAAWSQIELITQVAPEAGALLIGATLEHAGKVWVDDVALEVFDQGQSRDPHAVANPSFEEGDAGWPPDGWDLLRDEQIFGYSVIRSEAQPRPPRGGRFSALLASDPDSLVPAQPDEPFAQPLDGPAKTVTLQRTAPTYGPGSPYEARQKALPEKIAEVRPGIFYVDLSRIADDDFTAALDRLAAAKGVVFDLRGYPRNVSPIVLQHLTDHPLHSAQWNIPVTTRPHRQGVTWVRSHWTLEPQKPRLQGKVAFLTGGGAISYAESYMGIVEAYHLAEIVGGPTAGTNGNVNPFTLPGGYNLSWTGMKVLKHDGSRHHGVGILPTVPVSPTRRGVAAGKDEVLEKGIEVVSR